MAHTVYITGAYTVPVTWMCSCYLYTAGLKPVSDSITCPVASLSCYHWVGLVPFTVSLTCSNNCILTFSMCRCYLVSCTCALRVFIPLSVTCTRNLWLCGSYWYLLPITNNSTSVVVSSALPGCAALTGFSTVLFVLSPVVMVLCFQNFLIVLLSIVHQTLIVWKRL